MLKLSLSLVVFFAAVSSYAQTDFCQDRFSYLQSLIKTNSKTFTCQDIIGAGANTVRRIPRTLLGEENFDTRVLQSLNTNPLICGRTDNNLRYNDRFGMPRTVDIGTQTVVRTDELPKGLLVPLLPNSLAGEKTLLDLYIEYTGSEQDAFDKDLQKMYKKHLVQLKDSRTNLLKGIFKSINTDEACAVRVCYEFNKENQKDCRKQLNSSEAYSYVEQQMLAGHTRINDIIKDGPAPVQSAPPAPVPVPVRNNK